MFKVPCPGCTARALDALEHDKMRGTPAGFIADFCEKAGVMWAVAADRGLVVDWSVQPCASREVFTALLAGSREAFARQAQDVFPAPPPSARH